MVQHVAVLIIHEQTLPKTQGDIEVIYNLVNGMRLAGTDHFHRASKEPTDRPTDRRCAKFKSCAIVVKCQETEKMMDIGQTAAL